MFIFQRCSVTINCRSDWTQGLPEQQEIKETGEPKYPYAYEVNPYCRVPEEISIETRTFRITPDDSIKDVLRETDEDFDAKLKRKEKEFDKNLRESLIWKFPRKML